MSKRYLTQRDIAIFTVFINNPQTGSFIIMPANIRVAFRPLKPKIKGDILAHIEGPWTGAIYAGRNYPATDLDQQVKDWVEKDSKIILVADMQLLINCGQDVYKPILINQ